jgi:Uma2 family endonuclease
MAVSSLRTKHWTRVEYERLIDLGAFRPGERLELVGGALLVCEPQGGPHFTAVGLLEDALRQVFGIGWTVRAQGPIALDEDSEPEPDIAVVPGSRRDHSRAHPSHPVLIVEVADSSLAFDRAEKGSLYARAGIADWPLRTRRTAITTERPSRWRPGDTVSPLAAPTAAILVASLLP